jgi:hypothetical protein
MNDKKPTPAAGESRPTHELVDASIAYLSSGGNKVEQLLRLVELSGGDNRIDYGAESGRILIRELHALRRQHAELLAVAERACALCDSTRNRGLLDLNTVDLSNLYASAYLAVSVVKGGKS